MNIKKKTVTTGLILFAIGAHCIFRAGIPKKLSLVSDIFSIASAASVYYDIKVKLAWDQLYNLDLFVTEPGGEIASRYNTLTNSGGEIGYYDQGSGEWTPGDSGDNEAPEVYRIEHGLGGTYTVDVYCPGTVGEDITTQAFVSVTLYEESSLMETMTFPGEGTQTIDLGEESWWNAGTFDFELPEDTFGCFIATAAYGSPFASQVSALCDFRDNYLINNPIGWQVVKLYYKLSPPCARFVSQKPYLKKVVRVQLMPLVLLARLFTTGADP